MPADHQRHRRRRKVYAGPAQLAMRCGKLGMSTLLIDADLRRPRSIATRHYVEPGLAMPCG